MSEDLIALGWSDDALPLHTHVWFYCSGPGTLRRSLDFLRAGLDDARDFCALLAPSERQPELLGALQEGHERDLAEHLGSGRLALIGGTPSLPELMAVIAATFDAALARGHGRLRLLAFLTWGQSGWPETQALKRFESALNRLVNRYPAVIVSAYTVPNLAGSSLLEGERGNRPSLETP